MSTGLGKDFDADNAQIRKTDSMSEPEIAAIREAQALVATYKAHEARQDSADPLALVWSARQIAPLLTALAAELERVTAERGGDADRVRYWAAEVNRVAGLLAEAEMRAEALSRERDRLREALERIVNDLCVKDGGEFVSNGSQVRCKACNYHRGVTPMHVYVGALAALAGGTDAAPPEPDALFPLHVEGCICPRLRDIAPNLIADLTCPIHGIDGTDPGDKLVAPPEQKP